MGHTWVGYSSPRSGSDSEAQFHKSRRTSWRDVTWRDESSQDETSERGGGGARVALLFSLTYQVVQRPTLYIGLHLSQLSMWD
jgi:hypothetical protein